MHASAPMGSSQNNDVFKLGEEFILEQNQKARLQDSSFVIGILRFFNDPCPPNVKCVWSGVGIEFEYRFKGEVRRGINLLKAFGYRCSVIRSDYESYAVIQISFDQD